MEMPMTARECALAARAAAMVALAACAGGQKAESVGPLSPQPLVGKFVWHDLVTDDAAAVKPFYEKLLGWKFAETERLGQPYSIIEADGRAIGGIVAGKGAAPQWLGYLSVPDVDRAIGQVRDGGGDVLRGPLDVGAGRAAVVTDPEGAVLGLVRATKGDPADEGVPPTGRFLWMEELSKDPAAMTSFYARLVGYDVQERSGGTGDYFVLVQQHPRAGVLRSPAPEIHPAWLTYVRVEDAAALSKRAEELGGRVVMAPRPDVRGGTLALVADPGGAVFALQQYPFPGAGSEPAAATKGDAAP
jgi:predicted enzyme related to lactoylglutathione lyase